MNFLKKLFGGGGAASSVLYLYVRPKMCKEIVEVRIDLNSSLSLNDDDSGYVLRKMVSGTRCPFQAEITLYFDKGKNLGERTIENGEFLTQGEYEAIKQQESEA